MYIISDNDKDPIKLTCWQMTEDLKKHVKTEKILKYEDLETALKEFVWMSNPYYSPKKIKLIKCPNTVIMYNTWKMSRGDYTPHRSHLNRDLPLAIKKACIEIIKKNKLGYR